MNTERQYIAIDLKSFYASVECVERGLDPLNTCLVVADPSRTEKTICLAVSPALKSYGIGGRPRLFEVVQRVREVNRQRGRSGKSHSKRNWTHTRSWPWTIWWHSHAWRITSNTAHAFMKYISATSPRRTSMSIPSTRFLWT